jgi:Mg-chelatase subunit ChlD
MRSLLLGLLPIACTVSAAAPSNDKAPIKRPPPPSSSAPIIERGEGCGAEIAEGRAKTSRSSVAGGYGGAARAPAAADAEAMPPPPPPAPGGRMPMQQPNGVRAGEWDDNANYRDYVKWLAASPIKGKLDIAARQFLVVTDKDGKAVPNCTIDVAAGGVHHSLVTMASGRALLFPHAMGFGDQELTATAMCANATATAKIAPKSLDGVVKLALDQSRALPKRRTIDLAFVLDTTGSMQEEIDAVKQTIGAVANQLSSAQTDVRIGLVEYKDRSDCLLTRTFPFASDLAAFSKSVANISASGGGDMPEDMHAGLAAALDKLQWRSDAAARMVVVIADAPPQFYGNEKHYDDIARRAASRGIKLYTVAASGMDDQGQVVMRQMASFTGASNMFVLRGGAGPQSVGGGDPKSSCGGTHNDYSSGKLDQLIMRKVRTELASLDADPLKIPGRGQDENAKPCDQRMVVAN